MDYSFKDTNDLFNYISHHLELVPYMSVYVAADSKSQKKINTDFNDLLLDLSNFYNIKLIPSKPTKEDIDSYDFSSLTGYHNRMYHALVFAEKDIFEKQMAIFDRNEKLLRDIIDLVTYIREHFHDVLVIIDKDKLFNDLQETPTNIERYKSYYNFRFSLITRLSNTLTTVDEKISELKRMIEIMSLTIDTNTSFFPQHPLQTSFESILMSPLLPYSKDINGLIDDFETMAPSMFVDSIFEEVVIILKDLHFNEKRHDMALVLLLYRYIFNRVYSNNSILNKKEENVLEKLKYCCSNYIDLPKEYCPEEEDGESMEDAFRYDEYYSKAVESLEETQWHVNPFDILNSVYETIKNIEVAASMHSKEDMTGEVFPFEVTFGLFMEVLFSSQIMNWCNIVELVVNYTPQTGISANFDYARANMEASKHECEGILESLKKEK